jgi:hypothetical protein
MQRQKKRNPSKPISLAAILAVGGLFYLAYRKWRGLGNGDYGIVKQVAPKPVVPRPVTPKPVTPTRTGTSFWQDTVRTAKSYGVPQQTPQQRPVVVEPSDPKYLKFREKRIAAAKPYGIWSPDESPPSAESAAMSLVLPVVKTPVTAMLEETEHQRAYDLQNEIKDTKSSIREDLSSVLKWAKELGSAYELGLGKLKEQEAARSRARTQDEIDTAEDEMLRLRWGLENIAVEIHRKHEGGYRDATNSIEGSVDGIREKFGDEEAEKAKLELTMEREFLIRKYQLLPDPNSSQAEQRASTLLKQMEARQDQRLMRTNPGLWVKMQEAKQERARQEAEEKRITAEEEKLRSNPLLQTPGPRRSPLYTASSAELEKVKVSPEVEERMKEFARTNTPVPNEEGIYEVPKVGSPRFKALTAMMQIRVDDLKNR